MERVSRLNVLIGIFLISASGLMLEVTLTRIFSSTIWYHYTFIAISVALFGWGTGGFFLNIPKTKRFLLRYDSVAVLSLMLSFSIPLFLWIVIQLPLTPDYLSLYFIIAFIPFFLAGMCLALAFDIYADIINKLYFSDLIGASIGTLSITLILTLFGGETTTLFIAILPAMAAFFFLIHDSDFFDKKVFIVSIMSMIVLIGLMVGNYHLGFLSIKNAPTKGLYQHLQSNSNSRIVYTKWNSYSKIDVVEGFKSPLLARIYIDSDAWTNLIIWDGRVESMEDGKEWFRYLPFHLQPRPKTLVIGPGGGVDVLLSLVAESRDVTAVELNPIIVDVVRGYGKRVGNIYDRAEVKVIIDEGRNFISRSNEKYDIILLGFVDSWASVSSGGLSLSENYLYTVEAFQGYFEHLNDNGTVVFIRWQVDIPRLVSNSVAMMQKYGISPQDAGNHMVILLEDEPIEDEPTQMLFILKKSPFTREESKKIMNLSQDYKPVHIPYLFGESPYKELFEGRISPDEFYSKFDKKVDPVTDDSPFYFASEKPYGIPNFLIKLLPLPTLLLILLIFTFQGCVQVKRKIENIIALFYFSALGMGFMLLEIGFIQKFILLLGHPIFALSVILFTLLFSSGIGSYVSGGFKESDILSRLSFIFSLIFFFSIVYAIILPDIISYLLPLSIEARIIMTSILLFPLGFFLGMPFPLGLRIVKNLIKGSIPLMWGVNGVMSVFGSITTVVVGLVFGFSYAIVIGGFFYLLALVCCFIWRYRFRSH